MKRHAGRLAGMLVVIALMAPALASAQAMFSLFVGTKEEIAARMIALAAPKAGETVIDLGAGDGRLVIASAKLDPGIRGVGVDLNSQLVNEAKGRAQVEGVSDRTTFLQQNVFDADLSKVDVIYMWLFPELQRLLRPKILREARPGTRIVTQMFDMGTWQPDKTDEQAETVRMWIVPADIAGNWSWSLTFPDGKRYKYEAIVDQVFQQADAAVRVGKERRATRLFNLRGADVSFSITIPLPGYPNQDHDFVGKVKGNVMTGTVKLRGSYDQKTGNYEYTEMPWRAERTVTTGYFKPTGLP